jgi:Beta-lactamase
MQRGAMFRGIASPDFEAMADLLADNLRAGREIGASIGVYSAGRPVAQIWGGLADPGRGISWGEHTMTPIASTSKASATVALLVLADQGRIDLDEPVATYGPAFAQSGKSDIPSIWSLQIQRLHGRDLQSRGHPPLAGPLTDAPLTGVAGAEDLEVVTDLAKPVLLRHRVGPPLHRRSRDLDRTTADAADQMMVVAGRAPSIGRLTVVGSDRVELANFGHELQGSVDRGQPDAFALMPQVVMDLLSCPEIVAIGEDFLDRSPLPGFALSTRRLGCCLRLRDRPSRHLDAPRRPRPAAQCSS